MSGSFNNVKQPGLPIAEKLFFSCQLVSMKAIHLYQIIFVVPRLFMKATLVLYCAIVADGFF